MGGGDAASRKEAVRLERLRRGPSCCLTVRGRWILVWVSGVLKVAGRREEGAEARAQYSRQDQNMPARWYRA